MAVTRSVGALIGTDESTLQTIAANTVHTGSEVDVLGSDDCIGEAFLYLVIDGASVATVSLDIKINSRRVTGEAYEQDQFTINVLFNNTVKMVPLGLRRMSRFMSAIIDNNDPSNPVDVFLGYELFKIN
jgi:hypothetical protein